MTLSTPLSIGEACFDDFGWVAVAASERGLCHLAMQIDPAAFRTRFQGRAGEPGGLAEHTVSEALRQLGDYFGGRLHVFDLPIDWPTMRPFQQRVLQLTAAISYGQVRTYGDLAQEIGDVGAARAVGRALATNPIGIVLPCHRVVGADGGLHGFSAAGGLATKAWLLRLEGHPIAGLRLLRPDVQPELPGLFTAAGQPN
ncbi:MAG TPA: methylated-DNA--[protein]-cysteine S-methyltransferase [Anaerolineaceae bacterium]|jgi:methylated-DNA-[protein]-cysteine S-methyltransferase